MKRIKQLETMKEKAVSEMKGISDLCEAESRTRTEEEGSVFAGHVADLNSIEKELVDINKQSELERSIDMSSQVADSHREPVADFSDGASVEVGEPQIVHDPKHGFNHFGDFGYAVQRAYDPSAHQFDDRLAKIAAASGMSQGSPSEGGFLVPAEFANTIYLGLQGDSKNLLSMTDNYTVQGETLTFPAINETSRADGSRWGGIQSYWRAEAAQMSGSKPTFREMKLEPQELYVFVYTTDKLLRNSSIALSQFLTRAAIDEIGFKVGDAIINGSGAGQPLGILASDCVVSVAKEGSQAAATVVSQNLSKMWARMHTRSKARALWLMNTDVNPELDNLFIQVTNVAGAENVGGLNPRIYNPDTNTIKGRSIEEIEYAATLGTAGDIILADLGAYATGTKGNDFGGVRSDMSIHLKFDYGETAFRFTFEVDGQPWINSAITPYKGSNTVSPFVTLAVRS